MMMGRWMRERRPQLPFNTEGRTWQYTNLPDEILEDIFTFAMEVRTPIARYRTFFAISTVCHHWRLPAFRAFCSHGIALDGDIRDFRNFIHQFTSAAEADPTLTRRVRSLTIPLENLEPEMAPFVVSCANVTRLCIPWTREFANWRFHNWPGEEDPTLSDSAAHERMNMFWDCAAQFPSLAEVVLGDQYLSHHGHTRDFDMFSYEKYASSPPRWWHSTAWTRIKRLRLLINTHDTWRDGLFLPHLNPKPLLQDLSLSFFFTSDGRQFHTQPRLHQIIASSVQTFASDLISLSLYAETPQLLPILEPETLPACPRLLRLHLKNIVTPLRTFRLLDASALETLHLEGEMFQYTLSEVLIIISSFPALLHITYNIHRPLNVRCGWDDLDFATECIRRNIRLERTTGNDGF